MNEIQKEVSRLCGRGITVTLTDKYPNVNAFRRIHRRNKHIIYKKISVDARNVPEHLHGFRTLFTAFHHFKQDDARKILIDAAQKGQSIGIFELAEKDIRAILKVLVFVPFEFLYMTLVQPKRDLRKIFFTIVVPVIPFFCIFDGIISILRVYTIEELKQLVEGIEAENYHWEIGLKANQNQPDAKIIYLVGHKEAAV